jgi:heme-degrading monooxygenase HmoA
VKPGHEDAFVAGWQAMADWTASLHPGQADVAHLLRDRADRSRFISFGAWPDEETVVAWRALPEFAAHVDALREHLDGFLPGTFDVVAEIGTG